MSTEVYVYADWEEFNQPMLVGTLRSVVIKKKEHFSFSFDTAWLQSSFAQSIDLTFRSDGHQFNGHTSLCII